MKAIFRTAALLALTMPMALSFGSSALAVPDARYQKNVGPVRPCYDDIGRALGCGTSSSSTEALSLSGGFWGDSFASALSSNGPTPSVTAIASFGGSSNRGITAAASVIQYDFTVVGPNNGPVPISLIGFMNLDASGSGRSQGVVNLTRSDVTGNNSVLYTCESGSLVIAPRSDCGRLTYLIQANALSYASSDLGISGSVYLQAFAGASGFDGSSNGVASSASAFVDPYIQIDPSFLGANPGYSIVVSPGLGNTPAAIPEPATWALMIGGFGMAGAALRRRRATRMVV